MAFLPRSVKKKNPFKNIWLKNNPPVDLSGPKLKQSSQNLFITVAKSKTCDTD